MSDRVVALIERARAAGDPGLLAEKIPYSRFMGITAELSDGALVGVMRYHDQLIGNAALPALHGGTLGALLESTAIFEVLWQSDAIVLPKTINLTVDFLRSGKPVDTYAAATITRQGRRVANVRAEAWQEDRGRPIAAAHCHLLLVDPTDE